MFRVLSLAGGGLRGAYGIGFLAELEARLEKPLTDYFDLIAGTSTGSITAAALCAGFSAHEMQEFYEKNGRKIFTRRPKMEVSPVGKLIYPFVRRLISWRTNHNLDDLFQSRYCPKRLEAALVEGLGSKTLADLTKCRLIIPAVNLTDGVTCVFRTPHLADKRPEHDWKVSDIVISATAAPTYFPHKTMPDGKAYVDGALWANDPGLVAMAETARIIRCQNGMCSKDYYGVAFDSSQIHMLSIGTGQSSRSLSPPDEEAGIMYWARHAPEVLNLLQIQGAQFPLKVALGDRYHQFDFTITEKNWTIDNTEMVEQLFELGREDGRKQFDFLNECFFSKG